MVLMGERGWGIIVAFYTRASHGYDVVNFLVFYNLITVSNLAFTIVYEIKEVHIYSLLFLLRKSNGWTFSFAQSVHITFMANESKLNNT